MTRSNWEVEDGAEPSLVNNSSSTFSLFWTIEHRVGRPADGPVRLGWLKSSRHRVKNLGPGLARQAVRLTLQARMTLDDSVHVLCTGPHQATINRADDLLRERLRREKASLEREDAERADAAREQARASLRRHAIAAAAHFAAQPQVCVEVLSRGPKSAVEAQNEVASILRYG